MRWGPTILCGWPGLARLWTKGHWPSLWIAIGFSLLVNLALISTFVWPQLLGDSFPIVAWPLISVVWITSALVAYRSLPELLSIGSAPDVVEMSSDDTLFIRAQAEYLKGSWTDAERLFVRQLEKNPRDVQSRLFLATLFRHTRRIKQAHEQLAEIQKFDESVHWDFEVQREKQLIELIEKQIPIEPNTGNDKVDSEHSGEDAVLSEAGSDD